MLPPFAIVEALLARLAKPDLPAVDAARAPVVLDDVSAEVRLETGRTWCDDAGELLPDLPPMLAVVTLRAAERAMRNPSTLHSESLGEYRRTFADQQQPAGVYLTEGERDLLGRIPGATGPAAGIVSVPIERDVIVSDTWYVSDQYGGDRIPWGGEAL